MGEPVRRSATRYCEAPECERETTEGRRYCAAHWKQLQRGGRLTPIREAPSSPEMAVVEAAATLADAEEDSDYERAMLAVVRAAERMVAARGWRPPPAKRTAIVQVEQQQAEFRLRLPRAARPR